MFALQIYKSEFGISNNNHYLTLQNAHELHLIRAKMT